MRTCKTVWRRKKLNKEANSRSSQFSYSVTVVEITMKLLEVVTSPSIYLIYSWYLLFKG